MTYEKDLTSEGKTIQTTVPPLPLDREEFWADTCRDVTQMHHATQAAVELYRKFGCRFCVPGHQQVQGVLSALDSAVPLWEKEHPELFFQTLELNYPELIRRA